MKLVPRYTEIADQFAIADMPSPVSQPSVLLFNDALAEQLDISVAPENRAMVFGGNYIDPKVGPVALGYSGHQFAHFSPRLGDGRAHLLGAVADQDGLLWDIQLKGSGATPFSRGGDGRCAIGPAVREYIMSEAMHALGVPTTRCLAVVATGETVYRQPPQPGAIVTRVASSHIRVGSFQYLATQGDVTSLKALADLAIARHYPHIESTGSERYLAFLAEVIKQQITLVISWMRVGFIHGVMNTDNTLISGETIDYGPCAMMNQFDFDTVFSSIDRQGRYAFGNQPNIANWNCARLAESLIPLINEDDEQAVAVLSPLINGFAEQFNHAFTQMWAQKLGLDGHQDSDTELVAELLALLSDHKLDYTNTFNALTQSLEGDEAIPTELTQWSQKWQQRTYASSYAIMRKANPKLIPRNHIIENILKDFNQKGQSAMLSEYLQALRQPYQQDANELWCTAPQDEENYQTFCGT
ncbi:YdiU family protein [Pseudoalteromonas shioyasakiensis]|uniref:protein adenylyltransferase SelO n=1 Tax=Pseudoalteromonas shioyasakiensis TaxID=1190813 RepID=UPI0021174295|nr:YdiU family protein [Pseudoalteromonas shioyasakiensis]MCQ8879295.1 YdiU family protein [Pseudoalteromonas shioyasakiensis]